MELISSSPVEFQSHVWSILGVKLKLTCHDGGFLSFVEPSTAKLGTRCDGSSDSYLPLLASLDTLDRSERKNRSSKRLSERSEPDRLRLCGLASCYVSLNRFPAPPVSWVDVTLPAHPSDVDVNAVCSVSFKVL